MSETNPNMSILTPSDVTFSPPEYEGATDTITVVNGLYEGVKFRFDVTWLSPRGSLDFHYTLIAGELDDKADFDHAIAHLLADLYNEAQASGEMVFHGGSDELGEEIEQLYKELNAMDSIKERIDTGTFKKEEPRIELSGAHPTKNLAQQIMQAPGAFMGKPKETATNFLDRLAAQGQAAMGNINK